MNNLFEISVKGKGKTVPFLRVGDAIVLVRGRFIKQAEIFDEYWLEADTLPDPANVITCLRKADCRLDLFSFSQRVPDVEPKYSYDFEWDNLAVLPISTYEHWLKKQISSAARRNIRASEKRGIAVRVAEYDDEYVRGIMSIYNESPIRQGRRFWHYGKDFETVKIENGTYAKRSTFLAAYCDNEMVGYLKIVWDKNTAAIMQILSKVAFLDQRPNNALLAEAVRQCCLRNTGYLLYEKFVYGGKTASTLTRFKQSNGFVRMDVPRYFVPLSRKGSLVLRLGVHRELKEKLPERMLAYLLQLRTRWYERRFRIE